MEIISAGKTLSDSPSVWEVAHSQNSGNIPYQVCEKHTNNMTMSPSLSFISNVSASVAASEHAPPRARVFIGSFASCL